MTVSVTMPALGESVTEGTVTRWLKHEGEAVQADEPLLEISTDKVDTEIPAPASGVLVKIVAQEDETVPVGAELAVIGDPAESNSQPGAQPAPASATTPPSPAPSTATVGTSTPAAPAAAPATPAAPSATTTATAPPVSTPVAPAAPASASNGSATPVLLPALGESVTEGTVTRWLKQVGDDVREDEPLLEISTDKVDTEIPAPASGVLLAINVGEDETVPVGTELAVIGAAGATSSAAPAHSPATPSAAPAEAAAAQATAPVQAAPVAVAPVVAPPAPSVPAVAAAPAVTPPTAVAPVGAPVARTQNGSDETYVTPLVRKLAAEHGIDLATLTGTGVGGRVRKQDVIAAADRQQAEQAARAAAAAAVPAAAPATQAAQIGTPAAASSELRGRTEPLSRLRKVIADRMVSSLRTSAQLTTVVEVDVTRIASLRQRARADFEAREGVKLSFLPFFARASVDALKAYPNVNASIDTDAGTVTYHDAEHLGIAVDTDRGLLVPVIRDAGDLSLGGLARKITDIADRTRSNRILPDELSGGTFTLTNTGSRGALFDTPIINQPQVAILGTGSVVKRPVVVTDAETGTDGIAVRSMVYLALTYDHRLVDGADAARFLTAVKTRLEDGDFEAELGL